MGKCGQTLMNIDGEQAFEAPTTNKGEVDGIRFR